MSIETEPRHELASAPVRDDAVASVGASRPAGVLQRAGSIETVCALVLVLFAGLAGSGELHDNSFLTHLATGRWITSGNWSQLWMGSADPYLWTSRGQTWVVQSWLASVVYDGAERVAGAAGIRLLVSATCMALAVCLWRLSAPGRSIFPRVVAVGGALAIGGTVWSERPYMFGLLFLALALLAADGSLRAGWLVPVGWLWVNTHGSFPLGIAALAALVLGAALDRAPTRHERRALTSLSIGCLLGGLLSPVGPVLLWFPITLLTKHDLLGNVQEWKSPDFAQPWALVFVILVIIALASLRRRPSFRSALPLVIFAVAGLMAARNVVVASVVLVPILARGLEGIGSVRDERNGATRVATVMLAVLITPLIVASVAAGDFALNVYPVTAVDWLDERGLLDGSVVVVHQDFAGNYLEYRYGGSVKPFIDDRYDLHDRELIRDYLRLARLESGWDEVLARRGVDAVVWARDSELSEELARTPGWDLVFDTATATHPGDDPIGYVIYCRHEVVRCTR